jgi:starch synthase
MKVALSVVGKFHSFDLARELEARQSLHSIFTGYPRAKLKFEQIPSSKIKTYPWFHAPYMALKLRERLNLKLTHHWEYIDCVSFDRHVARNMPKCDVFVGMSSSTLFSGRSAKALGTRFVCDRGSSHIRTQNDLLKDEHLLWRIPYVPTDPRIVAREEAEYHEADCITVPSSFSVRSFIEQGVSAKKVRKLSYGVDLKAFRPTSTPSPNTFDILFVGGADLRKGVPYLLSAYKALRHPRKSLSFAGSFPSKFIDQMKSVGLWSDDIKLLGHLNWQTLPTRMSQSHALVLPSIEDGFGLVLAQALACACPVIATDHTGAPDLIQDGEAGFIVPIRRADLIADRLQHLADDADLRERFRANALLKVQSIGGWHNYGDRAMNIYQSLLS